MRTAVYSDADPYGISIKNMPVSVDDYDSQVIPSAKLLSDKEFMNSFEADRDRGLIEPTAPLGGMKSQQFTNFNENDLYSTIVDEQTGLDEDHFNLSIFGESDYMKRYMENILPIGDDYAMRVIMEAQAKEQAKKPPSYELITDDDSGMGQLVRLALESSLDEDKSVGNDLINETGKKSSSGGRAVMAGNKAFARENDLFKTEGRIRLEQSESQQDQTEQILNKFASMFGGQPQPQQPQPQQPTSSSTPETKAGPPPPPPEDTRTFQEPPKPTKAQARQHAVSEGQKREPEKFTEAPPYTEQQKQQQQQKQNEQQRSNQRQEKEQKHKRKDKEAGRDAKKEKKRRQYEARLAEIYEIYGSKQTKGMSVEGFKKLRNEELSIKGKLDKLDNP